MPVHNALPHLDEAVQSILDQTIKDFEFVIYDDGSTDGSFERLQEWALRDKRIVLHRGTTNLGPAASSTQVVRLASNHLIARMDADDVSMPERLEVEAKLLADHPDVALVASLCEVIDVKGRRLRGPDYWRLTRRSWVVPFPHGSIMFRREAFDAVGGYRDGCEFWEDLDFFIRIAGVGKVLVSPRSLYRYRQSISSTRIASDQRRVENALDRRYRALAMLQDGHSYDSLLSGTSASSEDRVDPRVFVSLGLLSLWAFQRPTFVRRFLQRARLRPDATTVVATLWLFLAKLSPSATRLIMNLRARLRNALVSGPPATDQAVEWRHPPTIAEGEVQS